MAWQQPHLQFKQARGSTRAVDAHVAGVAGRVCSRARHAAPQAPIGRRCAPVFSAAPSGSAQRQQHRLQAAATASVDTAGPQGDVYIYEPEPLQEGEEKHVISVFVADESGLINRVAGVFARRGANIESLAVGLNGDSALFTIVVTGTANTVANLVKQLSKLVKVRFVEDITNANRIERELMLLKLRAPVGAARTEVLQLAEVFRARVVDVGDEALTLSVSGDPGKTLAMQRVMSKYGVLELARTGRISLKRGEALLEMPGLSDTVVAPKESALPLSLISRDADVYGVECPNNGAWQVQIPTARSGSNASTLSIEVADVPGVLNQVTGVFARRGYNVQSLAVGPSVSPGMSRISMVVPRSSGSVDNLLKQVSKLVNVQSVTDLSPQPFVERELGLIKVACTASQRGELRDLVSIFRGSIVDVTRSAAVLEVVGKEDKLLALTDLLEPFGILEVARTGRIALQRESKVDTRYLERQRSGRVW